MYADTNGKIKPIALVKDAINWNSVPSNSLLYIFGWGRLSETGATSNKLMYTDVKSLAQSDCKSKFRNITDRMFCAGNTGKDSCFVSENLNFQFNFNVILFNKYLSNNCDIAYVFSREIRADLLLVTYPVRNNLFK